MAAKSLISLVASIVLCGVSSTAFGQNGARARTVSAATALAQAEPKPPRARTRIRVTPLYPYRTQSLPYPPPYDIEYPGPGFVRQCTSWLAPEHRPSGTVIVPHSRCWWERGRAD
ncbi:MAG TPA: hypothetical protein VGF16_07085 [Bryobacteraceae bacterium]|jgi:hypothetical protein